jgi:hypothetical protein
MYRNLEFWHFPNAYLFSIQLVFNRLTGSTHNLLKQKKNKYDERGNKNQVRNFRSSVLTESSSEGGGTLARFEEIKKKNLLAGRCGLVIKKK